MYLPKIKQKVGGKIAGKLMDLKTGRPFNGAFVQDFAGNFFKGSKVTAESEKLKFVPDETAASESLGVKKHFPQPTSEDYTKGTVARYFIKDGRSGKVVEINRKTYLIEKQDKKLYKRLLKVFWYIKGDPEDSIINGYKYPGVKSKNQDVINQAEKKMSGIGTQALTDTAQFVRK